MAAPLILSFMAEALAYLPIPAKLLFLGLLIETAL